MSTVCYVETKTVPKSVHDDPELAAKCYPSGEKNFAIAQCYCGEVEIEVCTDNPLSSGFCHCMSCRTTHAAPMYQVLYCATSNVDCMTGALKEGKHEVQVVKGFDKLIGAPEGMDNPYGRNGSQGNENFGGMGRLRCKNCGTRMMNAGWNKSSGKEIYGVFPGTFTEKIHNFIRSWQPRGHVNCEDAILPVSAIHDGLPKYVKFEGPRLVE